MSGEPALDKLTRLRGLDFLAHTGDRKSVLELLQAIGEPDPDISRYSMEAVFKNPHAYQELMNPGSLARLKVIHRFSEKDVAQAIRFSLETLSQDDANLRLLALDVLDHNIAYLEKGIELFLGRLLKDPAEAIRVKASRLLVLFSEYESIDLSDGQAVAILEQALDSPDPLCRQMAYGLPPSLFYKMKAVKNTLQDLQAQILLKDQSLGELSREIKKLRKKLELQTDKLLSRELSLHKIKYENQHLSQQLQRVSQLLAERESERRASQEAIEQMKRSEAALAQLRQEQSAHTAEVEQAQGRYEELVFSYRAREEKFKQGLMVFFQESQAILEVLEQQKAGLEQELAGTDRHGALDQEKQQLLSRLQQLESTYREQYRAFQIYSQSLEE